MKAIVLERWETPGGMHWLQFTARWVAPYTWQDGAWTCSHPWRAAYGYQTRDGRGSFGALDIDEARTELYGRMAAGEFLPDGYRTPMKQVRVRRHQ